MIAQNGITLHTSKNKRYLEVIQRYPASAEAYFELSDMLVGECPIILLNGTRMSEQQLLLKTIEVDPSFAKAYFKLGVRLRSGDQVTLNNGTIMTQYELYLKAMELDPSLSAQAYYHIGFAILKDSPLFSME